MSDLRSAEDSHHRTDAGRRGGRKTLVIGALALCGCGWIGLATSSHAPYTCAVCRMDRVDRACFGLSWSTQHDTDCSRWYAEHVEPAHAHSWVAGTRCRSFGIPGLYGGYVCSIGGPITMLSRSRQVEIYRHFGEPLEAKRLFLRLGQGDPDTQGAFDSLLEWAGEGYPGTWDDWWEEHQPVSR